MNHKACPRCKNNFAIEEFYTIKGGKKKPYCRSCTRDYKREAYAKAPEYARASAKKWAEVNADKYKQNQERYRQEHRQELNDIAIEYRKENKEEIREKAKIRNKREDVRTKTYARRNWRMQNDSEFRERIARHTRKASRKWYYKNREEILAKLEQQRADNPEFYKAKAKKAWAKYNALHPEVAPACNVRRRAVIKGAAAEDFNEPEHRAWLKEWQENTCFHCNKAFGVSPHIDHVVPIAKGGPHTRLNLCMSCASCNQSKNDKILHKEWKPKCVPSDNYIKATDYDSKVITLSTFFISERNTPNASNIIKQLKIEHPGYAFIFDIEARDRPEAIENYKTARAGAARSIGARKTNIVEVGTEDALPFFDRTHIQGAAAGAIYLGLEYGGHLVACSAWAIGDKTVELARLSFAGRVVGGFSKLLKAFINHPIYDNVKPIISFADQRYATGDSYEKVGFKYVGDSAGPLYYYVNGAGMFHRRSLAKNRMAALLPYFDPAFSERDNAKMNGLHKVYSMNTRKYIFYPQ